MTPSPLETQATTARYARIAGTSAAALVILMITALFIERFRGQSSLRRWKEEHISNARSLELTSLWPKPNLEAQISSHQLSRAIRQLPPELTAFSGRIFAMVPDQPGRARRGSQEPQPPGVASNSWEQFETAVSKATPELTQLRRLLKDAPASMGDDIVKRLDGFPDFVGSRSGAQALHAVTIHDLHRGDLTSALENLLALSSCVRLHSEEPTLTTYMTRVAIVGLLIDACWDALQAPGWTGAQLDRLQQATLGLSMLVQVPRVFEGERAVRLSCWESFRSHSYSEWVSRHEDLCRSFGIEIPNTAKAQFLRQWQQWGFHPLWQFAWAEQEELEYLKHSQTELVAIEEGVKLQSWRHLEERLKAIEQGYRPPTARWRFHGKLPLSDDIISLAGVPRPAEVSCPHPGFRRAWQVTFRNLTLHQLAITAIALKRHQLRHGQPPATLEALVPEFLPAMPRDLMDGQPLRYRLSQDGSIRLYSIAGNFHDDGGEPQPRTANNQSPKDPWNGRDWVWPQPSFKHGAGG